MNVESTQPALFNSISDEARVKIELLFPQQERGNAERLLIDRLNPALKSIKMDNLDRWHFAALKLSEGKISKLQSAIDLGRSDWRDFTCRRRIWCSRYAFEMAART